MKILVRSDGRRLNLVLPTGLVFSPTLIKAVVKLGKRHAEKNAKSSIADIDPKMWKILCSEIRRTKRKHKHYELLVVQSADGDHVSIIL